MDIRPCIGVQRQQNEKVSTSRRVRLWSKFQRHVLRCSTIVHRAALGTPSFYLAFAASQIPECSTMIEAAQSPVDRIDDASLDAPRWDIKNQSLLGRKLSSSVHPKKLDYSVTASNYPLQSFVGAEQGRNQLIDKPLSLLSRWNVEPYNGQEKPKLSKFFGSNPKDAVHNRWISGHLEDYQTRRAVIGHNVPLQSGVGEAFLPNTNKMGSQEKTSLGATAVPMGAEIRHEQDHLSKNTNAAPAEYEPSRNLCMWWIPRYLPLESVIPEWLTIYRRRGEVPSCIMCLDEEDLQRWIRAWVSDVLVPQPLRDADDEEKNEGVTDPLTSSDIEKGNNRIASPYPIHARRWNFVPRPWVLLLASGTLLLILGVCAQRSVCKSNGVDWLESYASSIVATEERKLLLWWYRCGDEIPKALDTGELVCSFPKNVDQRYTPSSSYPTSEVHLEPVTPGQCTALVPYMPRAHIFNSHRFQETVNGFSSC